MNPARVPAPRPDYPPVTPASVAAARAAQQHERALVEAQTGIHIDDTGRTAPAPKGSPS